MINLLSLFSLLVWPFGIFLSWEIQGIRVLLLDIVVLAIFALNLPTLVKSITRHKSHIRFLTLFIASCVLSLIFASPHLDMQHLLISFLYLARLIIYSSLIFVKPPLLSSRRLFTLSALFFVALGLYQYLISPDMRDLALIGFDDHYYRLVGSMIDPNFSGLILVVILFVFSYLQISGWWIIGIPLALTFSRASFVSFFAGLFVLYPRLFKKVLISISVFIALLVVIPKPFGEGVNLFRTYSISSRIITQFAGLQMFYDKPIWGHGYQTLVSAVNPTVIDNSFIVVLATTGLVGFYFFTRFMWSYYFFLDPGLRPALLAIFVHSMFNNSLFVSHILYLLVILSWLSSKGYKKL